MADDPTPPATPTSPTQSDPVTAAAPVAAAPVDGSVLGDAGAQKADPAAPATDPATPVAEPPTDPVAPALPEKYEFNLGEGVTVDPAIVATADPILRELGLSQEAASKLAPLAQQVAERTQAGIMAQLQDGIAAQRKEWLDAYNADPEIGGANRERTEQLSAKALDAMGFTKGHPFRQALTDSGFGNHPDMIRAFSRLGEMVGEDNTFARPNAAPSVPAAAWDRMYPNG